MKKAEPMLGPQDGRSSQARSQDCCSDGQVSPPEPARGSEPSTNFLEGGFSPLDVKNEETEVYRRYEIYPTSQDR
ncbi:NT-3 growth factor receptor isoform X6 [Prionailurus iriomotensis]